MAIYGYDEQNKEYLPQDFAESEKIASTQSELGEKLNQYMVKTVSEILLSKNVALTSSAKYKLAEELRSKSEENPDTSKLDETYLKNVLVKNEADEVITDLKQMQEWVQDNFHFVLSDTQEENAWIHIKTGDERKDVMAVTTKMLEFAENDAQFKGVIAHELGHYFVSKRYGNEVANRARAINEKMADQHAVDCLHYLEKDPREYGQMFSNLYGLHNLSDAEKLAFGMEEHGSPSARLSDVYAYAEGMYGDKTEKLNENPAIQSKNQQDDAEFNKFKQEFNSLYAEGRYVGYIEKQFADDEKFQYAYDAKTGRLDFGKIKYEDVLDKLNEIVEDPQHIVHSENLWSGLTSEYSDTFQYTARLQEAADLIMSSSKEGLELNDRITEKANNFLAKAALSRTGGYNLDDIHGNTENSERTEIRDALDDVTFALAYPDIDYKKFKEELAGLHTIKEIDDREKILENEVLEAKHLKIRPNPIYSDKVNQMQRFVSGEGTFISTYYLPRYSVYATDYPHFEMPERENAKGSDLPWLKTLEAENNNTERMANLFADYMVSMGLSSQSNQENHDGYSFTITERTEKPFCCVSPVRFIGEKYDFAPNREGKIVAVGAEETAIQNKKITDERTAANQFYSDELSKKLDVLDKLQTLSNLTTKQEKGNLSAAESLLQQETLQYLVQTPELEKYLIDTTYMRRIEMQNESDGKEKSGFYVAQLNNRYENIDTGVSNVERQYDADYAKLSQSSFFKTYGGDITAEVSTEQKVEAIRKIDSWNFGENTGKLAQNIAPVIVDIMQKRKEFGHKEAFVGMYDITTKALQSKFKTTMKNMEDEEKKDVLRGLGKIHSLKQITDLSQLGRHLSLSAIGFEKDETIYTNERIDYYENLRRIYNLQNTDGKPEALYENLASKFQSEQELGQYFADPNHKSLSKETDRLIGIGTSKLNNKAVNGEYKIAEYEVMRYINNPENPPLDITKTLEAFPKYDDEVYNTNPCNTTAFKNKLCDYILQSKQFSEAGFEERKQIYDMMLHKNLFDEENLVKFDFQEAIKKSYEQLPEEAKKDAAKSMLQDRVFEYDKIMPRGLGGDGDYRVEHTTDEKSAVDYPPIANFYAVEYGSRVAKELGIEPVVGDIAQDGHTVDANEVTQYHNKVKAVINDVNNTMAVSGVKDKVFETLADDIMAQDELCKNFELAVTHSDASRDMSRKNDAKMRVKNTLDEYLEIVPETSTDIINFINKPYSKESGEQFKDALFETVCKEAPRIMAEQQGTEIQPLNEEFRREIKEGIDKLSNEDLCIMHADFWEMPIEGRSAVTQNLLEKYAGDDVTKAVDLVVSQYISPDQEFHKETKDVLNTLYAKGEGKEFYRPEKARFMLGAMLAAEKPDKEANNQNMGIGKALARFCASNGPAWVKFGQALSNIPNLPADIREPLAVLKDNAVKIPRWEWMKKMRKNLNAEKMSSINKVLQPLGHGSFWGSIAVQDKDGNKSVIQMLQDNAANDAMSEFAKIGRTTEDLSKIDKMYKVLGTTVERAKESSKVEVDIYNGYNQYVAAASNYAAIDKLEVNGIKFNLNTIPWTDFHQDENGNGFKQMPFAEGTSLKKADCTPEEKKILAAAYVATEMGILLGGKAWDIDRHGGQQNFAVKRDEAGKITAVDIGIYDTGALRPAPTDEEKAMVSNFYAAVIVSQIKGEDLQDVMFREVSKLEKQGLNTEYVSDIQRGCIAIMDLCEYQKAEKDDKGNILKPAQSFDAKDYMSIFKSVMNSGMVDHKIIDPLIDNLMKDPAFYASLAQVTAKEVGTKIQQSLGLQEKGKETSSLSIVMETKGILRQKEVSRSLNEEREAMQQQKGASAQYVEENKFARSNSNGTQKDKPSMARNLQAIAKKGSILGLFKRSKIKPASVEKDLAAMSAETGTAMFSYNELHHSKAGGELHCDYKKVIDGVSKAQKITHSEAEKKLLECEALRPLPNGEYAVDVGYTTRNGGGRNHGGTVFFTFSDSDIHNKYHEMAHSYQKQQDLFNDAKLDKMYAVSEQGLKAGESKEEKLADKETYKKTYKTYLKEAHSEIFAQTALMLRKRTTLGFMEQALYAQSYGEARNAEGFIAGIMDKDTGRKAKLYACKPVMHAAIKEVAAIRKAGKRAEYFNPDGTLNAKKVATLCEKIVLDNAYSPRTYKAFTENDFNDTHSPQEKDWKKGTLLAAAKLLPAKMVMSIKDGSKQVKRSFDKIRHSFLRRNDKAKLEAMTSRRKMSDNPKIQAINDYAYIQAKIMLISKDSRFANADDIVQGWVGYMHEKGVNSEDLQKMSREIESPGSLTALSEINSIIKSNKDNPYFKAIMENPGNIVDIKNGKKIQLEQEQPEITKEVPMSDKEKISKLSGRTGDKPHYAVAGSEETKEQTAEQTKTEPTKGVAAPQKTEPTADLSAEPQEKVAKMSKKEKGKFFHNLRLGVNTIMSKMENGIAAIKGNSKTQTQEQTQTQTQAKPQENTSAPKVSNVAQAAALRGKGKEM